MRFAQLCLGLVALRSEGLLVGGPPRAEIARGSWVLLHGLSHSVELNGQEAIVEGMDADRYVVRLVDSHLYKKVRPEHLEPDRTRRSRPSPAVPSPCGEHEFDQPQELPQGPKELAPGAEVWVHGLTTAASMNDRKVLVRCFNPQTERYVVQLVDDDLGGVATGPLRAIKAEHLSLAESESDDGPSASVEAVADDSRGQVLRPGSHGKLVNLRNVAMNGKVVRILGYKEAKHHYVVKLPNGALRRVDASKVERAEDDASIPLPRMSVCNAFGRRLKVLLENSKAISLDFPSCHDFEEVSSSSVTFMLGSKELARADLGELSQSGIELTVAPSDDPDKARVHQNRVEVTDHSAYFLHLIDARRFPDRRSTLSVQRGPMVKVLPMDKSYRLERVEDMSLTLVDGSKQLKLAFTPEKSKTYVAIVTSGTREDVRKDGLVLHKLGAWTSAEQLADEA